TAEVLRIFLQVGQLPVIHLRIIEAQELVAVRDDAVMPVHTMRTGELVIMVVEAFAPRGQRLALEERYQAPALHFGGHREAGCLQECLGEVQIADDILVDATRLSDRGPADEEWRAERFLKDPAFVEPAVLTEVKALIGGVDDNGILGESLVIEILKYPADALIHGFDTAEVIV